MSKGKLILKGTIKLLSPAMIGSGRDENSDMDVLRDSHGNPYIPATSFVGVIKHVIKLNNSYKNRLEDFWGSSNDKDKAYIQSSIIVNDLLPVGRATTTIRDGVRIDNKKGVALEGAKFDYEIIERGAEFSLFIEVNLNGKNDDFKRQMFDTIIHHLQNENITIGAKTNSGFGKIKLTDYKIYKFDFSKKEDVLRWLKQDFSIPIQRDLNPLDIERRIFEMEAAFSIKNSLIIRSYNYNPNMPDVEHIKSNDSPVLPGTSIKGAIRARAERIINTLGKSGDLLKTLFGYVDESKKEAFKGKVIVEETIVDGYPEEVQTRIKIDRFTGGVMEGALLETKPLFRGRKEKTFNIKITVNDYKDQEVGLMLLVLKDLWTGDLPIGGEKAIGRGVLTGKKASISWNGGRIEFEDITQLNREQKNQLQRFVSSLVNYGGAL